MHIAYLTIEDPFDPSRGGGIAAYLRALVPALVARGHRVTVLAKSSATGTSTHLAGSVRVVPVRLPNAHWYLSRIAGIDGIAAQPVREAEWSWGWYRAVERLGAVDPPDVLEAGELGAALVARRNDRPLVVRLHGVPYEFEMQTRRRVQPGTRLAYRLHRLARNHADALTSPSHWHAREVSSTMAGRPRPIRVIPNAIAATMLDAAAAGAARQADGHAVLYTGRMAPVKGIEVLVKAMDEVVRADPAARCILAGVWQLSKEPRTYRIGTNGSSGAQHVRWIGHLPSSELVRVYRQAAVFAMPSYYEAFCLSVVEAMAFGLPVVATSAGALPEIVADGVTGIVVAPGDSRALADALASLLRDPERAARMGRRGRERVLAEFTPERAADMTLRVYQDVMKSGKAQ